MRAEGNGHTFNSTMIRSLGVFLQFTHDDATEKQEPLGDTYIPTDDADKMRFGILPVEKSLGLEQDFRIGNLEDILATMRRLDVSPTGEGVQELLRLAQVQPGENAGFSDLIEIVASIMPIRSPSILRVRKPAERVVGLNCHMEGPIVFYERLKRYIQGYKAVIRAV